jgi:hypothetical protein
LIYGEHQRRPNLELPLPTLGISVALVEGLSTGCSDFEHEPFLLSVEEVNFGPTRRTGGRADQLRDDTGQRHGEYPILRFISYAIFA